MLDTGACGADIMLHSRAVRELGLGAPSGLEDDSNDSRWLGSHTGSWIPQTTQRVYKAPRLMLIVVFISQ